MRRSVASPSLSLLGLIAVLHPIGVGGCGSENVAPDCYVVDDDGNCRPRIPFGDIKLNCDQLPAGVVDTNYKHAIAHPDLVKYPDLDWSATGLPPGLSVEKGGLLRGAPLFAGSYDAIEITVRDVERRVSKKTRCGTIKVAPSLRFDLSRSRGCIRPGEALAMYASGGSGEPFKCELLPGDPKQESCPHGLGNGWMPKGVQVSPDCQILGQVAPTVPEWGTFAWIVKVTQGDAERYLPFCIEKPAPASPHKLRIDWNGKTHPPLQAINLEYRVDDPLKFGSTQDPRFEVTAPCKNNTCDGRSVSLRGSCSPFDSSLQYALDPVDSLRDPSTAIIGFSHRLTIQTPGAIRNYNLHERPWVLNVRTQYCTSSYGAADKCNAPESLRSHFSLSLIAWPPGKAPK